MKLNIIIEKHEVFEPALYYLFIDGEKCIEDLKLENVVRQIKKYMRLRFKESLK